MLVAGQVYGYEVAAVPSKGPAEQVLLDELDQAVAKALTAQGHEVIDDDDVAASLTKLGLDTVSTQKEADRLGASLSAMFVIAPWVSPMAGQNRIEILAYFLPDGRAEMLEQIAIEGDLDAVVADMMAKLVSKQGLLGPAEPTVPDPGLPVEDGHDEPDKPADVTNEGPTDEQLLEKLDEDKEGTQGHEKKPPKPGLGDPFKVHALLGGGYSVLLNSPASGGSSFRNGGHISGTVGYVLVPKVGLEVAGDIHVFMGKSGVGFGVTASTGVHFPLAKRFLLGARLGLGFFKGATGSQRSSFLMRISPVAEVILHDRVFLRFELLSITLIAGGDKSNPAVGIMGFDLAIGARF
jgi:hypothetical protein